jgi:diaminohydroxyphosphoribosylaminopyrimidine deaminase/5-amino-6-(5-phosphoribosylamino)uracil reductase
MHTAIDPTRPLEAALTLAAQAIGLSDPNPRVGCVIVSADGHQLLGAGHTQPAGQAHAEVMALREAAAGGADVRGATVYVTLEPCAHHGRTPPCCDALIAAGVARVVVAVDDPNPQVDGQGVARLRAAGITVDWGPAALAQQARELNIGFFSRMRRGRPWVRMKIAASLDGRTALADGSSQWITSEAARTDGHAWRKRAGALLSGAGTVRADDPRLDVRLVPTAVQPLRAIIDSRLDTPLSARLFEGSGVLRFYAARPDPARIAALRAHGAEVTCLPKQSSPTGDQPEAAQVDLGAALADLARLQVNELHVEAGERLNASLIEADLVDEFLIYLAPVWIGPGRSMAALGPLACLAEARRFEFMAAELIGGDLRLRARPPGRADF